MGMSRQATRDAIKTLALSQGSYGRLLEQLDSNKEYADAFYKAVEEDPNINDIVDLIMAIEC